MRPDQTALVKRIEAMPTDGAADRLRRLVFAVHEMFDDDAELVRDIFTAAGLDQSGRDVPTMPGEFVRGYLETALWASSTYDENGNNGRPLDEDYSVADLAKAAVDSAREDCESFWASHWQDMESDPFRAGHDFWLTRNRHGAGFWDGDWPDDAGRRLTEAAHVYGSVDLYVGDDGLIHSS